MINVGIIHYTGKDRGTLATTIASLNAAGVDRVTVFSDDGQFGAAANLCRAITALARSNDAPFVLVVDDDMVFQRDAFRKWWTEVPPFGNACSLWTIEQNIPHDYRDKLGWVKVEPHFNLWGGAVIMERNRAKVVALFMDDLLAEDPTLGSKPDAVLFQAIRIAALNLHFHIPSLADHIGTQDSTLGNVHDEGQTRGFRFNEWNTPE
jgi:hypothetical protein